jgi:hypothetical protein
MAEAQYVLATARETQDSTLVDAEFDLDIRLRQIDSRRSSGLVGPLAPGVRPYRMEDDANDDTKLYTCKGYTCPASTCPHTVCDGPCPIEIEN